MVSKAGESVPLLVDRCSDYSKTIREDKELNDNVVPGLAEVFNHIPDKTFTSEHLSKGLLKVFIDSKEPTFTNATKDLRPEEQKKIKEFAEHKDIGYEDIAKGFKIGPTRGTREEFDKLHSSKPTNLKHLISQDVKTIKAMKTGKPKDDAIESHDPLQAYDIGPKDGKVPVKVSFILQLCSIISLTILIDIH